MTAANDLAVRHALEAAGVEFINANGGTLAYGSASGPRNGIDLFAEASECDCESGNGGSF